MAAFTSKASGNWSSGGQTTWNQTGVPGDGDTVTIAAHTITVDVDTTIGTSPNDATTAVISMSSASSVLTVASSKTLTVKGNFGLVNGSTINLNSGASLVFDASGSGGTPVYTIVNGGFTKVNFAGTSIAHCTVSAPVGKTFSLGSSYSLFTMTFVDFTRQATTQFTANNIAATLTDCTFTSCGKLTFFSSSGGTQDRLINRNKFASGTDATTDLNLSITAAYTSGNRQVWNNVFTLAVTQNSLGLDARYNYFGGGLDGSAARTFNVCRLNFFFGVRTNGQRFDSSMERNYFFEQGGPGNPHFAAMWANTGDVTASQCVFECADQELVDTGDCIFPHDAGSGHIVSGINNIVLPLSAAGATATTGCMVTGFATEATLTTKWRRNTCHVTGTFSAGAFNMNEGAGSGHTGEVAEFKSNIAWSSNSTGYLYHRVAGTVTGEVVASGADYNWTFGGLLGTNGRGYDGNGGTDLWDGTAATGSNAATHNVDNHQSSGDPQFYAPARNLAAWSLARGYGSGFANGLLAVQVDPTRTVDLINYIFEGFKPQNASCRNAAHDGGCVGAANFQRARGVALVATHRAHLSKFGL